MQLYSFQTWSRMIRSTRSAIASELVNPGDSMPVSEMNPGSGCVIEKSTAGWPGPDNFGRIPASAREGELAQWRAGGAGCNTQSAVGLLVKSFSARVGLTIRCEAIRLDPRQVPLHCLYRRCEPRVIHRQMLFPEISLIHPVLRHWRLEPLDVRPKANLAVEVKGKVGPEAGERGRVRARVEQVSDGRCAGAAIWSRGTRRVSDAGMAPVSWYSSGVQRCAVEVTGRQVND